MVLVDDTSSECALQTYVVSLKYLLRFSSYRANMIFRQTDRWTDVLTFGFLVGTYSVRKSSQESVSTQQIPGNFY